MFRCKYYSDKKEDNRPWGVFASTNMIDQWTNECDWTKKTTAAALNGCN